MKTLFIHTMGCQMNVYDSDRIGESFASRGYEIVDSPEKAGVIVVNTCSVRAKAEHKAISALGQYAALMEKHGPKVIIAAGCVAEQHGRKIAEIIPGVSIIAGPDHYTDLVEKIEEMQEREELLCSTGFEYDSDAKFLRPDPGTPKAPTAFLTVMKGCSEHCTYCIVPKVRGRARFRPFSDIVEDAERLVDHGCREIMLLGQTVNAYAVERCSFADLIAKLDSIEGLDRIRYTSPHPLYMPLQLIQAHRDVRSLCEHVHLPVQAGSSRVLRRMGRRYRVEDYTECVEKLKSSRPGFEVSTDIIVGFPGEGEDDFEQTLRLIRELRFSGTFSFAYSERETTPACRFEDNIPQEEKLRRLALLHEAQAAVESGIREKMKGRIVEVLVEGKSRRSPDRLTGRTRNNHIVNFDADGEILSGSIQQVLITEPMPHCLSGQSLKPQNGPVKEAAC